MLETALGDDARLRAGLADRIVRLRGSIEDRQLLRSALSESDTIAYCAAMTTPGTSATDPALEVMGNLLPLARLLECASDFPEWHIIYLSSGGAIYGDDAEDATESNTLRPRSYYGAGKASAEAFLAACAAAGPWTATTLRPSNLYGPGQQASKGFAIVPTLFDRAKDGKTFQVWGDGSVVRDYLFLDDLVEAIVPVDARSTWSSIRVAALTLPESLPTPKPLNASSAGNPIPNSLMACVKPGTGSKPGKPPSSCLLPKLHEQSSRRLQS